jgi:hypothetical protein
MDDPAMAVNDDQSQAYFGDVPSLPLAALGDLEAGFPPQEDHSTAAESEDNMNAEDDASDTNIKKQGHKKLKKGLAVRDCINTAAAQITLKEHPKKKQKDAETKSTCISYLLMSFTF